MLDAPKLEQFDLARWNGGGSNLDLQTEILTKVDIRFGNLRYSGKSFDPFDWKIVNVKAVDVRDEAAAVYLRIINHLKEYSIR